MIERKNEVRQGAITAVLSAAALAGSLKLSAKALDYRGVFIPGTVINGEDASGHTVSEMEEILGKYDLTVKFREGKELQIPGEKIDYHYVADGSLDSLMENQKIYLWGLGLYRDTLYEISEEKDYSEDKLMAIINSAPQMKKENMTAPQDACLGYEDGKFVVTPEVEGTTLDPKLAEGKRS